MTEDGNQDVADSTLERFFYHTDRMPLVYWQDFSGATTAVALVAGTTILTFVTGMSILSASDLTLGGPVATLVPDVVGFVPFAGVLLAFLLAGLTVGLRRRKRIAWTVTLLILPLITLIPLTTLRPTDLPLLAGTVLTVPLLFLNRNQFDRSLNVSSLQVAAIASLVGVLVYGIIGAYARRNQFAGLETWGDAVYYVFVTVTTVGYGDITPIAPVTKWFSLSLIVFGTAAFTFAAGSLVAPAIEKRLSAAFGELAPSEVKLLEDHVLVLGVGPFTEPFLEAVDDQREVVVVTERSDTTALLDDSDATVLRADPTDAASLQEASIDTAVGVVVATGTDADDAMAVVAARRADPTVRIVAAAHDHDNVAKMRDAGADHLVSPHEIGGTVLAESVLAAAESRQSNTSSNGESTHADHVLVLGYGPFTEPFLAAVDDRRSVVVITDDADAASRLSGHGATVLEGDPTDETVLQKGSIDTALGVVAATGTDADDTMAIVAARRADPTVRVVAAAADHDNVENLRAVGADEVISPSEIGGRFLAESIDGDRGFGKETWTCSRRTHDRWASSVRDRSRTDADDFASRPASDSDGH